MAGVQEAQAAMTSPIEEYDLELSLAFRPFNCSPHQPKKLLEPTLNDVIVSPSNNARVVSKREEQAIRRREAKVKRDLKRKVAIREDVGEERGLEKRSKIANFGIQRSFSLGNAGGFRPYQGQNGKFNGGSGGGGGDGETRSSISTGSSSGVSDNHNNNYHSNSSAGGNSSDTGSHSSHPHSHLVAPNMPTTNVSQTQPHETLTNHSNSNLSQPQLHSFHTSLENTTTSTETLSRDRSSPDKKPPLPASQSPSPKEAAKGVIGKPPKPNGQTSQQKGLLPQMPCVSATGNGPNGKTITGFLCKYTKTEVSIVCVCHGTSFSPAGFVEHAGGVDVEHPLRHIRVVPFALS